MRVYPSTAAAAMSSMTIGNSSKSRRARDEAANSKAAILARKRERWKVQKEVHDTAQQFRGRGERLGESISLPGTVDSPSPTRQPSSSSMDGLLHQRREPLPRAHRRYDHDDNDILSQLTERIASRLKAELRNEASQSLYDDKTKLDVSTKIESFLQNELQQHTCPVCFEPMLPPQRSPLLLFPCGHTFCEQCIGHQKKVGKHQCPFCRSNIESVAVNHSLRQLMETFLNKKEAVESGKETLRAFDHSRHPPGYGGASATAGNRRGVESGAPDGDRGAEYLQKCRALKLRGRILKNELEDTRNECARLDKQQRSAEYVMSTLEREEADAKKKLDVAQRALDLVRRHKAEQIDKMDQVKQAKAEATQKIKLIETTVATIERDADKAYVLLQNYRPGAIVDV